jgi:hypothetical protein
MEMIYGIIYMVTRAFFWTVSLYLIFFTMLAGTDESMVAWAVLALALAGASEISFNLAQRKD